MTKTPWADKAAIPEVPTAAARGKAASAQDVEKPKMPPPRVFAIGELETPPKDDPNELIRHRYLCRGSGMLVVGVVEGFNFTVVSVVKAAGFSKVPNANST